uniref:Uncharacterized protein n=1 Tax=Oryzias latipes TaxID=8090 RepID=A0A286P9U0_ORYLA|nr:hypothetical protein [Oryzias latipes]
MPRVRGPGLARKVARGLWAFAELVLLCGVNFFVTLYMHPVDRERAIALIRKREEAEVDAAINTVARSITGLDANIEMIKGIIGSESCDRAVTAEYVNELRSAETQRDQLRYMLMALRGRIDAVRLVGAVDTLSDSVGLQLNASAKINRTVLALNVHRDLDDMREPVSKMTVEDASGAYEDGHLTQRHPHWLV